MKRSRTGVTLLELMVALLMLAIVYAITVMSVRPGDRVPDDTALQQAETLRRSALRSGETRTARLDTASPIWKDITSPADGSVIADSLSGIDRLSGHPSTTDRWVAP